MSDDSSESSKTQWNIAFANLLLRLWVGLRLFMAGVDKFRAGDGKDATFNMLNYDNKTGRIAKLTYEHGFIPENLCNLYAKGIGYALLVAGVWVVLGLALEVGLFFSGLVALSLGFGLATLPDDTEVSWIGVLILIIAAALVTSRHKALSLDGLFFRRKGAKNDD
jgi:uncharacterized membrane protein YphA (DoxX/SURF4 family)